MTMPAGKQTVTFHLTGGSSVKIDLTPDELRKVMDDIDNGRRIGTWNSDLGFQLWILGGHVAALDYPSDGTSEWGNP